MRGNLSVIGETVKASYTEATGRADLVEQYAYNLTDSWPITPKVLSFTESTTSINETTSNSVDFNITVTGYPNEETFYWTISGVSGTVEASDFSTGLSGSFAIAGSYSEATGSFNITVAPDGTPDGTDSFIVQIRTGSVSGPIIASSNTITISDTSTEFSGISSLVGLLSGYTESTAESTVISAIESQGYTVFAIPIYNAMAERLVGSSGSLAAGQFRYDLFDAGASIEQSSGFTNANLNGYAWIGFAGFVNTGFAGVAGAAYTQYPGSTTALRDLWYPNTDKTMNTYIYENFNSGNEIYYTAGSTSTIFSDGQSPSTNGYNATTRWSADDGSWGFANGVTRLDGNGGPYISGNNSNGAVGCENRNSGDTVANTLYWGTSAYSSTTYKLYVFTKLL